jgi:hypothetical protein
MVILCHELRRAVAGIVWNSSSSADLLHSLAGLRAALRMRELMQLSQLRRTPCVAGVYDRHSRGFPLATLPKRLERSVG